LYSRFDAQTVLMSTLLIAGINLAALRLSWNNRQRIEKIKSLSDYVAVFGMFAFIIMLFTNGLIDALIWFIAFIQLALSLTFKDSKHYYLGLLITFALLSVGAAETKDGFYLFYIIAYCAFASISLGFYFMDRRLQENQGTYQHMRWPAWHRIQVIFALIILSFIIYLITPRFEAGNLASIYATAEQYYSDESWEQQAENGVDNSQSDLGPFGGGGSGQGAGSAGRTGGNRDDNYDYRGFSNSFDIRSEQAEGGIPPNVIVAYMQAEHGAYLKVETFDLFDGIRWKKSLDYDIKKKLQYGKITLQDNLDGNYTQSITIEENLGPYVPAASIPVRLTFPATVIGVDSYEMIKIPSGLTRGTHYSVDSSVKFIAGRFFSGDHYQPRDNDLQLPDSFDSRIRELSEQITRAAQTDLDKALLLEKHLRENYAYSYTSIFNSQNRTPIARFLFEDKKGHCEYFASSMAVMLRSLGIHSRLVTGFSAMVENPLSGFYEMRVLDGHAWVEAWVDGIGWAVFEATPFYTPPVEEDEITAFEKIQNYVEQLEKIQQESGQGEKLSLENIMTSLWQSLSLIFVLVFGAIKLFIIQAWKILIVIAIAASVVCILWKRWQPFILRKISYLKVRAYKPKEPKSAIRFYMTQIQILMRINGMQRQAGTTIEQYASAMPGELDDGDIKSIANLVNQWHYSTEVIHAQDPALLKSIFMKLYFKR